MQTHPEDRVPVSMDLERRRHERVPPVECRLTIKPRGFFGLFAGNRCAQWIDISEGGLGVLVSGQVYVGDLLEATLTHHGRRHRVRVEVRHVRPSKSRPDHLVVGLQFVDPPRMLQMCIRWLVDTGSMPHPSIVDGWSRV